MHGELERVAAPLVNYCGSLKPSNKHITHEIKKFFMATTHLNFPRLKFTRFGGMEHLVHSKNLPSNSIPNNYS